MKRINERFYDTFVNMVQLKERLEYFDRNVYYHSDRKTEEYKGQKYSRSQVIALKRVEEAAEYNKYDITPIYNGNIPAIAMDMYGSLISSGIDVFDTLKHPEYYNLEQTAAICALQMAGDDVKSVAYAHINGEDMIAISNGDNGIKSVYMPFDDLQESYLHRKDMALGPNTYTIYQLRPDRHEKAWMSYDNLTQEGKYVDLRDYKMVYADTLDQKSLEDLYYIFNAEHPSDFRGHSLSVSDIIVRTDVSGNSTVYYCDRIGFKQLGISIEPLMQDEENKKLIVSVRIDANVQSLNEVHMLLAGDIVFANGRSYEILKDCEFDSHSIKYNIESMDNSDDEPMMIRAVDIEHINRNKSEFANYSATEYLFFDGTKYLYIQDSTESSFDYTIYDKYKRILDGGWPIDTDSIQEAFEFLVEDNNLSMNTMQQLDYFKIEDFLYDAEQIDMAIPYFVSESFKSYKSKDIGLSYDELKEEISKQLSELEIEFGNDFEVTYGPFICGSRSRGLESERSDIDFVFEYKGNIKEDHIFNILHEKHLQFNGLSVDINPLNPDISGQTIQDYLIKADKYLEDKRISSAEYRLAQDLYSMIKDFDPYEWMDVTSDKKDEVERIYTDIKNNNVDNYKTELKRIIAENKYETDSYSKAYVSVASGLLNRFTPTESKTVSQSQPKQL